MKSLLTVVVKLKHWGNDDEIVDGDCAVVAASLCKVADIGIPA